MWSRLPVNQNCVDHSQSCIQTTVHHGLAQSVHTGFDQAVRWRLIVCFLCLPDTWHSTEVFIDEDEPDPPLPGLLYFTKYRLAPSTDCFEPPAAQIVMSEIMQQVKQGYWNGNGSK